MLCSSYSSRLGEPRRIKTLIGTKIWAMYLSTSTEHCKCSASTAADNEELWTAFRQQLKSWRWLCRCHSTISTTVFDEEAEEHSDAVTKAAHSALNSWRKVPLYLPQRLKSCISKKKFFLQKKIEFSLWGKYVASINTFQFLEHCGCYSISQWQIGYAI